MIPKVLHYLDDASAQCTFALWSDLHVGWNCLRWTPDECRAMMHTCYPHAAALFPRLLESQRRRLFLLLLLHRYGGMVVDAGAVPLRSLATRVPLKRLVVHRAAPFAWMAAPKLSPVVDTFIRAWTPARWYDVWRGDWAVARADEQRWRAVATGVEVPVDAPEPRWIDVYMQWRLPVFALVLAAAVVYLRT
jgi:hypothetical protein